MARRDIAVLGCGYWGKNLVRNFNELKTLGLVCDISQESLARAEEIAPGVDFSRNFAEAFKRSDIKAVVLATPAETHEELAIQALENGKDVFVEKPMALTVEQGRRMNDTALKQKRILMVGHILEYHPAVSQLEKLIKQGNLGRICYIFSNRLSFGRIRENENALWSFAPHDIALVLRLLGETPIEVSAFGGAYINSNIADVTVSYLRFSSGQNAHIFVSWLNPFKEQKFVVVGDQKMAVFDGMASDGQLKLYHQRVETEHQKLLLHRGEMEIIEVSNEEPLRNECIHFLECIRTRSRPLTDGEKGIQILTVLQACQKSLSLNGLPVVIEKNARRGDKRHKSAE